jgi:catechol 2,3-dioxygenase-like lactoylglutathione lyase family enzyme
MPTFKSLIPNLWVADVERSFAFYTDVLGFSRVMSVPDTAPYVWVRLSRDGIEVDLNDPKTAVKDYPGLAGKPLGATGCLFIEVEGVRALHDVLATKAKLAMPLITQPYGMTEFAIEDPDGYVLTFAEPAPK